MTPEPQHHAVEVLSNLPHQLRIIPLEGAERLMMAQQDDRTLVLRICEHMLFQPVYVFIGKSIRHSKQKVSEHLRHAISRRGVTRIEGYDPPVLVFKGKVAGLLAKGLQSAVEVAETSGIHLVIAIHRIGWKCVG